MLTWFHSNCQIVIPRPFYLVFPCLHFKHFSVAILPYVYYTIIFTLYLLLNNPSYTVTTAVKAGLLSHSLVFQEPNVLAPSSSVVCSLWSKTWCAWFASVLTCLQGTSAGTLYHWWCCLLYTSFQSMLIQNYLKARRGNEILYCT